MIKFIGAAAVLAMLSFAAPATAADAIRFPVFPPSGGVMCCCPSQWMVKGSDEEDLLVCAVPEHVVRKWITEERANEIKAYEWRAAQGLLPRRDGETSPGLGSSGMTGGRGGYLGGDGAKRQ